MVKNLQTINIRSERPDDYNAILRLTYAAFQTLNYPGRRRLDEHYLIYLLRDTNYPIKELSFVTELDGEIIGHIMYTRSTVGGKPAITFGPLSVLPKFHKQGIGRTLVNHSMDIAREMGFGAVVITGVPDYYPKLGFLRGRDSGITLQNGSAPDALMYYELIPEYLAGGGIVKFDANDIFEKAENDDKGFTTFHKQFMSENFSNHRALESDKLSCNKKEYIFEINQ